MNNGKVAAFGLCGKSVFLKADHFHAPGETVHADKIYIEPGGKAYNQAVAAARSGAHAFFIGAVGDDENGRFCAEFLNRENISHRMMTVKDSATAYACILTDAKGENRVTVYGGAADSLSADFVASCSDILRECSVFMLGNECPLEATLTALKIAQEYGIYTVYNPAPAFKIDTSILRSFDIITPNAHEAAILFDLESEAPVDICRALFDFGIRRAAVTLGSDGALLYSDGIGLKYPSVFCNAADTTGAGDCFNGSLAAMLSVGKDLQSAVEYAVNASALSVTRYHVMSALPCKQEVAAVFKVLTPTRIF